MKIEERRKSTLSIKLTATEYSALSEIAWRRRQRISDLAREVLGEAGLFQMPGEPLAEQEAPR